MGFSCQVIRNSEHVRVPSIRGPGLGDSARAGNVLMEIPGFWEAPAEPPELPLVLKFKILNFEKHMYWGQKNRVPCELSGVWSSLLMLQMRHWRLREGKRATQGHTAHWPSLCPITPQCTFISMFRCLWFIKSKILLPLPQSFAGTRQEK